MRKLDRATAQALANLESDPRFARVRAWLGDSLAETDAHLRSADGLSLSRAQGEAQCLAALIERIDNARAIANKLN